MTWARSEQLVAELMGGKVITSKASQLLDLDVICQDGLTISVKEQAAALKWGNYSFELALFDDDGNAYPGNWARCQADALAIVIPGHNVVVWDCQTLAMYLRSAAEWKCKRLTDLLVDRNREAGRRHVDALNLLVPRAELMPLAYKVIPLVELDKEVA